MTLQMSSRQRMLTTFGLQDPDRVRVIDEVFNVEIFEAALGYRPEYITSEDTFRCSVGLGLDASFLFYADYPAIEPEGNIQIVATSGGLAARKRSSIRARPPMVRLAAKGATEYTGHGHLHYHDGMTMRFSCHKPRNPPLLSST